ETPVPVQMSDKRGKHHQAYLWQYGRPGGSVVFDFRMGRGREGPVKFLGPYKGILQTDGYTAYDRAGGVGMVHAACWSHARHKVFDALKLSPEDRVAARLVARIDELFAVDAEARDAGMSHEQRHMLRGERSRPLLDVIKEEMEAARAAVLPASALGKAVNCKRQRNRIFLRGWGSDEVGAWSRSNQHRGIGDTGVERKQISWRQNMKRAGYRARLSASSGTSR
ncbi:MAG TPA: transposase, partial [Bryobacteraceae bacterium]|nr:transposase [Bryobacteraceae bacterium]